MTTLVIVESPSKAKKIGEYLGTGYKVTASLGHIADLPPKELGIKIEGNNFTPHYVVNSDKGAKVGEIKKLAKEADKVLLATDPDREGEALSWHLMRECGLKPTITERIEFHEITKAAITKAVSSPRSLDTNLINAQQARRVIDRLVGYELSPLLSSKIKGTSGLSAGRVQSVALRIVVEREREIQNFKPREFWTIEAELSKEGEGNSFKATLVHSEGQKYGQKKELEGEKTAKEILASLDNARWQVKKVEKKAGQRKPAAPFITSTLQQEASRKLGLGAKETMKVAQELYENGYITYMRTDSTNLSEEAQKAARAVIDGTFGKEYIPDSPPVYAKNVAGAQEAHEAIRPTKADNNPEKAASQLSGSNLKLYKLIWQRFIASQMANAQVENTVVDIETGQELFRARGTVIRFEGFLALYSEGQGDTAGGEGNEEEEGKLPALIEGETTKLLKLSPKQNFTKPPSRYGEASLIKALEDSGVGRPSTYANIMDTIKSREYVRLSKEGKEQKFVPTAKGYAVCDLLVKTFPNLFDIKFTAELEKSLDEVAAGKLAWQPVVASLYHPMNAGMAAAIKNAPTLIISGEEVKEWAADPNAPNCTVHGTAMNKIASKRTPGTFFWGCTERECKITLPVIDHAAGACPKCGNGMTRIGSQKQPGQFFYKCISPECGKWLIINPDGSTRDPEAALPIDPQAGNCPECGKGMVRKSGQYGAYWSCSDYPACRGRKAILVIDPQAGECPKCGGGMARKEFAGKKPFWSCVKYPDCRGSKEIPESNSKPAKAGKTSKKAS